MPTGPVRKPAGSRVVLENTGGKLDIDVPPQGLGSSNIGTGLFALAWNAFVAFWTVSTAQDSNNSQVFTLYRSACCSAMLITTVLAKQVWTSARKPSCKACSILYVQT